MCSRGCQSARSALASPRSDRTDDERQAIYATFNDRVNLAHKELERWLDTDESKAAGDHGDGGESTGHASGRRILDLRYKNKADLTADDYDHMAKVNAYIARHTKQRPEGHTDEELAGMAWTHSLKNWGHDPLKKACVKPIRSVPVIHGAELGHDRVQ